MFTNLISSAALFISLLVLGGAIGWIVGLSVSNVVSIVVSSVIAAAATVVAGLQGGDTGLNDRLGRAKRHLAVYPLTVYVLGLAIGTTVGMRERTGTRLSADPKTEVRQWVDLGIDSMLVAQRIFDAHYPEGQAIPREKMSVLFAIPAGFCDEVGPYMDSGAELFRFIEYYPDPMIRALAQKFPAPDDLHREVVKLCDQP
jgi:hypothetical protein